MELLQLVLTEKAVKFCSLLSACLLCRAISLNIVCIRADLFMSAAVVSVHGLSSGVSGAAVRLCFMCHWRNDEPGQCPLLSVSSCPWLHTGVCLSYMCLSVGLPSSQGSVPTTLYGV